MRKELRADALEALTGWTEACGNGVVRLSAVTPPMIAEAGRLAIALGHPLKDCVYLALAIGLGAPLVTCDAKFRSKASQRYGEIHLLDKFPINR